MTADDELTWTTTRCNRLLRPLSSKLAKLRREAERPSPSNGEGRSVSTAFATKGSPRKTTNFTRPTYKPRGFEKATDPDWRPGLKPGAGKKTYSGRGTKKKLGPNHSLSNNSNVSRPGEIAFTPLVTRMASQLHSSPQVQQSPLKRYGKNRGPLHVEIDRTQAQGDLQKLTQGLLEAYANILQATSTGDERRWKGTRSLMGACLRKLPAYIELEEHFAKLDMEAEEEEEERDVTAEIYEHLEAQFEQRAGFGWKPFRQVVRAHATTLMCNAVSEEILDLGSLNILISHCLNVSAWDEAEKILLSYLPLLEPLAIPINLKAHLFDFQKSTYLATINGFVNRTGRHRLLYDVLQHLIAHELLPLEWLATECMRPMWDRLARSVSESDRRTVAHAVQFFETFTLAGIGLPNDELLEDQATGSIRRFAPSSRVELQDALNTTYSSLLTVLCSIALVNNGRADGAGRITAQRIVRLLDSVVLRISGHQNIHAEMTLLEADTQDVQTFAQRAIWTVFASMLLHMDGLNIEDTMVSVSTLDLGGCINHLAFQYPLTGINIASILGTLPGLVSSTARGTGRIWKDDGFDQLQRLVQAFMSLSGCRLPHKLWTTKRLALESAIEFAQSVGSAQHLTFARDIEKKLHTQGQLVIMPSPLKNDSPSIGGGFRWEEGIGEWIACTPFARQGLKRLSQKPVPALELLPTPAPSEENDIEDASSLNFGGDNSPMWKTTDSVTHDDDDVVLHSSPIKQSKRAPTSSLGKRERASSPMVIIVSKRTRLTPPKSPVTFYSDLPEVEEADSGLRRSRRSRHEIKSIASRLRTQRSRTSMESGLRLQTRKTYKEALPQDGDSTSDSSSGSEEIEDDTASSESDASPRVTSLPRRAAKTMQKSHPQRFNNQSEDVDERDDLGTTPARPKPQGRGTSKVPIRRQSDKEWWKMKKSFVNDNDAESEDELSFH